MSHHARPPYVLRHADIDSNKLRLARRFRRAPTAAEAAAWQILRDRAIFGLKFRRQQIIAGFIVDFYCPAQRLVLELDGGAHDDPTQRERDLDRTEALRRFSIRVLRVPNHDVHEQALRVLLEPYARPEPARGPRSSFPSALLPPCISLGVRGPKVHPVVVGARRARGGPGGDR